METQYREQQQQRVRYQTEVQYREQRKVVMRPIEETSSRVQRTVVRKPVTKTVMQPRSYTTYQPVTTMQTQVTDTGSYVNQSVYQPGTVQNRLRWIPGSYVTDPVTGVTSWKRGGFHWIPYQNAGRYRTYRQYVPNLVSREVPVTRYVAKVVTEEHPVQVTTFE